MKESGAFDLQIVKNACRLTNFGRSENKHNASKNVSTCTWLNNKMK